MWSIASNSRPRVSGKKKYTWRTEQFSLLSLFTKTGSKTLTIGTQRALKTAKIINTRQLIFAIAGGVISTTANTHLRTRKFHALIVIGLTLGTYIQLKKLDIEDPRARIRVVLICRHSSWTGIASSGRWTYFSWV